MLELDNDDEKILGLLLMLSSGEEIMTDSDDLTPGNFSYSCMTSSTYFDTSDGEKYRYKAT